jgi:hypothetical protein
MKCEYLLLILFVIICMGEICVHKTGTDSHFPMEMCNVGSQWVRVSFLFLFPNQRFYIVKNVCVCVCVCVWERERERDSACVEIVYELPLLPNNTASEHFSTSRQRWEVFTGYVFIIGVQAWRWLWEYVTLEKRLTIFFSNEKQQQPVTSTFASLSIPRGGLYWK